MPANRSAALAGHEHHTFKDRGEVAGGAYNHKTMPDWRVKRHRSMMNRRADHIERKTGENQPTAGGAMDTSVGRSPNSTNEASAAKATSDGRRKPTGNASL